MRKNLICLGFLATTGPPPENEDETVAQANHK
jgi:hypothetical protein